MVQKVKVWLSGKGFSSSEGLELKGMVELDIYWEHGRFFGTIKFPKKGQEEWTFTLPWIYKEEERDFEKDLERIVQEMCSVFKVVVNIQWETDYDIF